MEFKEYQTRATTTDQNPKTIWDNKQKPRDLEKCEIIPLMGLVGEVGGLLSEYKKMLRDGAVYEQFPEQVSEEIGDILWYVATVATKFGLDLDKVAQDNLEKTKRRWHEPDQRKSLYDDKCEKNQKLPRTFTYELSHKEIDGSEKLIVMDTTTGNQLGDSLTDNTYEDDGYRYHDVLHLAFMAKLGWSPIFRKLLRKSNKIEKRRVEIDEAEDSGRPQVIEEAIIAAAYVYAEKHNFLDGVNAVDWQLLRHLQQMTSKLEVSDRTTWEWNKTLLDGFKVWRGLKKNNGGIVKGDLEKGTIEFVLKKKILL